MVQKVNIKYAERKDVALILRFIKELADYEKMSNEVVADENTLKEWICQTGQYTGSQETRF